MLKAYYKVGESGEAVRIAAADESLTWVYASKAVAGAAVAGSTPITDGKIPAADSYVIVYPVYKGQPATNGVNFKQVVAKPITYTITDADLTGLELAAQQYTTAPTITNDSSVVVTALSSEGEVVEISSGSPYWTYLGLKYSLTNGELTELKDGVDLRDVEQIYVQVSYTYENGKDPLIAYFPLPLTEAYADELDVEVDYTAKTADGKPLADSDVVLTVNAVNDLGIVAELAADEYNIIDRATGMVADITVAAEEQTFGFNAIVDDENGPKKIRLNPDLTIPAWTPYYEVTGESLVVTRSEDAEEKIFYFGDNLTSDALVATDYVVSGYTPHGTDEPIVVNGFELITTKVNAGLEQENIKFPIEYRQKINNRILKILKIEMDQSCFDEIHANRFFKEELND